MVRNVVNKKAWNHRNYLERKEIRIKQALERLGGVCVTCKSTINLQFDHIDRTTRLFSIPCGTQSSDERFFDEVDKCQLLCKTCHLDKTLLDRGAHRQGDLTNRVHGTKLTYKNGCRCDKCREANTIGKAYYNMFGTYVV